MLDNNSIFWLIDFKSVIDLQLFMIKALCIALLVLLTCTAPAADKMDRVPGYGDDFKTNVYSGYLGTGNESRWLHYAFVESANGANSSDPVTLWLNGGPGCSSLLGFLLEVGPYYLEDGQNYKMGDKLNENPYSWHKASHMLFFESPAGVGYSYNLDKTFKYTDASTAQDSFNALLDFFSKYPEYKKNKFFIAGESYAGKYIPDLAVLIDKYNLKQKAADRVNLIAILVGNGVMSFNTLEQSTIEYIIKKEMVDPEILPLYEKYCRKDFASDECGVFLDKYEKDTDGLNPYDIYGYCFIDQGDQQGRNRNTQTQQSILLRIKEQFSRRKGPSVFKPKGLQGPPCGYFQGVSNYFNFHAKEYHAKFDGQRWNAPCAENITYNIDPKGSIQSYQYLLNSSSTARKYGIVLYNGNADAVVPFIDTYKGLEMLKVQKQSTYDPWFADNQHAGFQQQYTGILFVIFKGASHQVPQSRRLPAFQFFKNLVTNLREKPESHLSIESQ